MKRTRLFAVIAAALVFAASSALVHTGAAMGAVSSPNQMLKGSYGYFIWDVFGSGFPFFVDTITVAEIGVLTADGNGNLHVTENVQSACAGCPATNSGFFSDTGTYSLNPDGTGEADFNFHHMSIVVTGKFSQVLMAEINAFGYGKAMRQDPDFISTMINSFNRVSNTSFQCIGINPQFPNIDFPSGISVVVEGRNHNVGTTFTGSGIVTFDQFSFTFSGTQGTISFNPDGTYTFSGGVGVLTSATADNFSMSTDDQTVQYCANHFQ